VSTCDHPIDRIGHRRVVLAAGRSVTIRPVGPGDVDGLVALYAGLSDDDHRLRFFSSFVPPRSFFERVATVAEHGGFGVVAVDGDDGPIVAEASYYLLPDGDGELAMAVSKGWRGWLGAYLLDTLIEAAAARGVPNLEAEVLVVNGRMLSLLRNRGYATLPSGDWVSLHLIVGTAGPTPVWPASGPGTPDATRPRVLVETPGGRWHGTPQVEAAGLTVITCSGPRGPRYRCPVLAGRPCPLAAGADAVVLANAPAHEEWGTLVESHARLHPGVPVLVEPREGPQLALEDLLDAARGHHAATVTSRVGRKSGRSLGRTALGSRRTPIHREARAAVDVP
jgi:hypothetical protein